MLIRKVLMCRPDYFQVKYAINPWMKVGEVDSELAMKQWQALVSVYQQLGIDVEIVNQDESYPDMVFAADQGMGVDGKWLLSHFRYLERQGESQIYKTWFESEGYELITLPENIYYEGGGETVQWRGWVFIGSGFRSSAAVAPWIESHLGLRTLTLQLVDPRFYHLDTCLLAVNADTVMYYPAAFSKSSQQTLSELVPNLTELTEDEVIQFGANSVVAGGYVVMQKNNPTFKKKIEEHHLSVIEVDVSEFIKAGGGAHCLTCVLK